MREELRLPCMDIFTPKAAALCRLECELDMHNAHWTWRCVSACCRR